MITEALLTEDIRKSLSHFKHLVSRLDKAREIQKAGKYKLEYIKTEIEIFNKLFELERELLDYGLTYDEIKQLTKKSNNQIINNDD